ncbi:MAG TPA: ShlB/FhaC/HecB family hemolysin secretion/activation protein [Opitutaceae bacterium]|nr:ShlB/FhaC/HecB family hemolysin secretion/activation protein [Opitutaceae bacterium]
MSALPSGATAQAVARGEPFAAPPPHELERRVTGSSAFVRRIRVEGARSLPPAAVADAVRPYENRVLGMAEIRELQQRLTRLYLERGFASSGVLVPDTALRGDELTFQAVEGTVTQVRFLHAPRRSRASYLTRLLVPDDSEPLNVGLLQERLAWLRDSGIVDRINAEVVPLPRLGESELLVHVEEPRPWSVRLDYDNHHSPTIGARRATLRLAHRNVTGWGDSFESRYGDTEGLNDVSAAYSLPLPATPLRLNVRWERSDSLAISPTAFRALDIRALSTSSAAELSYAFLTRASQELSVFATRARRRSDTTLLGMPFSFVPGIEDGASRVDVNRAGVNFSARQRESVLFARVQASVGRANVAGDTSVDALPARRFRSLFLQSQYARRLPWWQAQAVARVEAQHTPDILLPLERYSLGGAATVRGYRENLTLRDRALLASGELQVPVTRADSGWSVAIAAFYDYGWSRNTLDRDDGLPRRLAAAGLGLIANGPAGLAARLYVARPSRRGLTPRDDIQDRGVHFMVSWEPTRLLP